MIRYGIIQLSDLQFGKKHRFGIPSTIADTVIRDVVYLSEKHSFVPIYLLLTGDITETAHAEEFLDAKNAIKQIASGISIDQNSILAIPGNHDINWRLAETAIEVGDSNIKYYNYNMFARSTCNTCSLTNRNKYQRFFDNRLGIEFLFLNSCEMEDHNNHYGFIDKEKLVKTITKELKGDFSEFIKICLTHHRIELNNQIATSVIQNSYEIQSILFENDYNLVLTGHIHESRSQVITQNNKTMVFSGAGAAGVNTTQRTDGMQNQYTIHVLDSASKTIESYWRSYSPSKRTKFGLGGWTDDNSVDTNPSIQSMPKLIDFDSFTSNSIEDPMLITKYNIKRNPFTFNNAEKISASQILKLFVESGGRNKGAVRLTGDAIIRGSRGSGKTMLLRYLNILGNIIFDKNFHDKKVSESFPVLINLSLIHSSEWKSNVNALLDSAEKLIFESVLSALEEKNKTLNSAEFKNALFKLKQKLGILVNKEGSIIWKLGVALSEFMSSYFSHILLLIDEVAPVFPKEFFTDLDNGFQRWMNSIRNSGPYFTRIAVYPNDFSDMLNEDRFGAIVNLDFNVKNLDEYILYREYCIELANKYLSMFSINKENPTKLSDIINLIENNENDCLEQLLYASDGSSRRFASLMDKCITSTKFSKDKTFDKQDIIFIIKEFSNNLLESYNLSEKELAQSIAKVCKRQITYRFRLPNLTSLITSLHAKNEELNIVKLAEIGKGRSGTTYEFTYPYCLLMDIQTHYFKDTRKICTSRDIINGEWISPVTTITKDQLDYLNQDSRCIGFVTEIDSEVIIITDLSHREYMSESFDQSLKHGDKVSFIFINGIAAEIRKE